MGRRGSGKWKAISWDEAVNQVADNLQKIKDKYGAESLAWFSEDHCFTHIQQDFCKMYGTPNYHNHANLCDVARKASFKLVMGNERPLADFEDTSYALVFGWNLLGATKWIHLPGIWNRGRAKGAKMVYVDPIPQPDSGQGRPMGAVKAWYRRCNGPCHRSCPDQEEPRK